MRQIISKIICLFVIAAVSAADCVFALNSGLRPLAYDEGRLVSAVETDPARISKIISKYTEASRARITESRLEIQRRLSDLRNHGRWDDSSKELRLIRDGLGYNTEDFTREVNRLRIQAVKSPISKATMASHLSSQTDEGVWSTLETARKLFQKKVHEWLVELPKRRGLSAGDFAEELKRMEDPVFKVSTPKIQAVIDSEHIGLAKQPLDTYAYKLLFYATEIDRQEAWRFLKFCRREWRGMGQDRRAEDFIKALDKALRQSGYNEGRGIDKKTYVTLEKYRKKDIIPTEVLLAAQGLLREIPKQKKRVLASFQLAQIEFKAIRKALGPDVSETWQSNEDTISNLPNMRKIYREQSPARLKALREIRGDEEFGRELGVSLDDLLDMEAGRKAIPYELLLFAGSMEESWKRENMIKRGRGFYPNRKNIVTLLTIYASLTLDKNHLVVEINRHEDKDMQIKERTLASYLSKLISCPKRLLDAIIKVYEQHAPLQLAGVRKGMELSHQELADKLNEIAPGLNVSADDLVKMEKVESSIPYSIMLYVKALGQTRGGIFSAPLPLAAVSGEPSEAAPGNVTRGVNKALASSV